MITLIINAAKWTLLGTNKTQAIHMFWHQSSSKDCEPCRICERRDYTLSLGIFLIIKIPRWLTHACTKYRYVNTSPCLHHVIQIPEPYKLQKLSLSNPSLPMSSLNHGLPLLILPENLVKLQITIIINPNLQLALFPALLFIQNVTRLQALQLETLTLALT